MTTSLPRQQPRRTGRPRTAGDTTLRTPRAGPARALRRRRRRGQEDLRRRNGQFLPAARRDAVPRHLRAGHGAVLLRRVVVQRHRGLVQRLRPAGHVRDARRSADADRLQDARRVLAEMGRRRHGGGGRAAVPRGGHPARRGARRQPELDQHRVDQLATVRAGEGRSGDLAGLDPRQETRRARRLAGAGVPARARSPAPPSGSSSSARTSGRRSS